MNIITLTVTGCVFSLLGFVLVVLQWFRNRELKKALELIQRSKEVDIWTNIKIVTRIFDSLEAARDLIHKGVTNDPNLIEEISSARRGTINHYLNLLKDAVLLEADFNMRTIEKWININRLENPWRVTEAIKLLETSKMPDKPYPSIYRKENLSKTGGRKEDNDTG